MGQKTHPNGFRLITTQNHLSSWYKEKRTYKNSLKEDSKLRKKIEQEVTKFLLVSKIEITKGAFEQKTKEKVEVIIHALFPTEQEMFKQVSNSFENLTDAEQQTAEEALAGDSIVSVLVRKQIEYFDKNLDFEDKHGIRAGARKMFFPVLRKIAREFQKETGKILKIKIQLIESQFDDAHLIAKFVREQLEQRVPVRRILNQVVEKIEEVTNKGVKIQISGRLNGTDIARTEWDITRKVPLHTLNTKIDYAHHIAQTSSGILGIKIWLCTP